MAEEQPTIESAPTPSIKSLKNRFEQLAQEKTSPPVLAPKPKLNSSPQTNSRQRSDADQTSSSTPRVQHRELRNVSELSPGQKRVPPPPPPPRSAKKANRSPAVSPLLRPVPVPVALRSPRASPDHLSAPQDNEDDTPRGGGVASLRERFASTASSPPRPAPKPASRSFLMAYSEPNILDSIPPVPPRHINPVLLTSQSLLSPEDTSSDEFFDAHENPVGQSPRMPGVTSLRSRFS
ncbi:hypothetical protein DFH29DRAFT_166747 [Suillus ampliporus]|nr:hypothetical protein DFH29DRAFT_166747 [Suillus ampliporus]